MTWCPPDEHIRSSASAFSLSDLLLEWKGKRFRASPESLPTCDCASADARSAAGSDVTAREEVERLVLAAVGCLELIPQAELPLVLQLQPGDGLTQGAPVLADHAESGACGKE